jgi:1,4-dihydroxy-2-naphthoate octaprenyltransferase
MTLNLLLLNEFPDEAADRAGGRRTLIVLFGRKGAARIYAAVALLVPISLVGAVLAGALPRWALVAVAPSLLLAKPLSWALDRPQDDVPIPALGANVVWNLATNSLLAASLAVATWLRSS